MSDNVTQTKKSKLDDICWEIKAYNKLYNTWVKYGDYMQLVRPKLKKEGKIDRVIAYSKELEERSKRRKRNYGTKNRIYKR